MCFLNYVVRIPDQDVAVARVQPDLQHQSSINKKLGVRSQRHVSADDTDAEVSANSVSMVLMQMLICNDA